MSTNPSGGDIHEFSILLGLHRVVYGDVFTVEEAYQPGDFVHGFG